MQWNHSRSIFPFLVLATIGVSAPAQAIDSNFHCYPSRVLDRAAISGSEHVALDRYLSLDFSIRAPSQLCLPATIGGSPAGAIDEPEALQVFRLRPSDRRSLSPYLPQTNLRVSNALGTFDLDLLRPLAVMVPTATDPLTPPLPLASSNVDSFTCYAARAIGEISPTTVTVADQFGTVQRPLRRLKHLCVPSDIDGANPGAAAHTRQLLCFASDLPRANRAPLFTANPFAAVNVRPQKMGEVCVASAPVSAVQPVPPVGLPNRFTAFESGQVRPLALSPDGNRLFVANTPDNRLEVFDVTPSGLSHAGSIAVGLEPVAVAARSNSEVWVVNHLSDSVSVASVPAALSDARVAATLLVGDEPRDIVFAGPGRSRAFITTAHRGQNHPANYAAGTVAPFDLPIDSSIAAEAASEGVGRADVWVFDAGNLGGGLGGVPQTILTLFTDTPRALATNADGSLVYAAGFHSGNQTTAIHEMLIEDGLCDAPGLPPFLLDLLQCNSADPRRLPAPRFNAFGEPQPETGLIVKFDGVHWSDGVGQIWDDRIYFELPDRDVFVIDAMASPPAPLAGSAGAYSGVGTTLFNMAVNPVSGKVYVSNTEARNHVRFEGSGLFGGSSVRGHVAESRITILSGGSVTSRHLNKHIDYAVSSPAANAKSLAQPLEMAVSSDGARLYVAAFGSGKIGVFDTAALENDTFVPSTASQIAVSGGGPSGLALDESRNRLYVLTRFDNGISVIDTAVGAGAEVQHLALPNPEPQSTVVGRRFLYDAALTSDNGDTACGSCHIFGDLDSLAWDLGDPDSATIDNLVALVTPPFVDPTRTPFASMKGPMATQSLRGLANHGPMQWRGDRNGAFGIGPGDNVQPDVGSFDEVAAFQAFNSTFVSLNGRSSPLTAEQMQQFTDFVLQLTYPPNPLRNLDDSLTADQQAGKNHFETPMTDTTQACADCHVNDRSINSAFAVAAGLFGSSGEGVAETADVTQPQNLKVPHLRNLYQKVGMFGTPGSGGASTNSRQTGGSVELGGASLGPQIRGFGFLHDGSTDTIESFMRSSVFSSNFSLNGFSPVAGAANGDALRRKVADFLLAFDSNLYPIVGQQVTYTTSNAVAAATRIALLIDRAGRGECELVVKGKADVGYLYVAGEDLFHPNRGAAPKRTDAQLRADAQSELTYTCVPPGSGQRLGLDADLDGYLDGDESDVGSDHRDAASTP